MLRIDWILSLILLICALLSYVVREYFMASVIKMYRQNTNIQIHKLLSVH